MRRRSHSPHSRTIVSLPVASELWAARHETATDAEQATAPVVKSSHGGLIGPLIGVRPRWAEFACRSIWQHQGFSPDSGGATTSNATGIARPRPAICDRVAAGD